MTLKLKMNKKFLHIININDCFDFSAVAERENIGSFLTVVYRNNFQFVYSIIYCVWTDSCSSLSSLSFLKCFSY